MLPKITELGTKLVPLNICYKNKIISQKNNDVPNIYHRQIYVIFYLIFW